jgi:twitching motility protein PilT
MALVDQGRLGADEAENALSEAGERNRPVALVLAQHGLVEAEVALRELSKLSGLPAVDIFENRPMGEAFRLVPEMLAREIGAVGYRLEEERLTLACAEPIAVDELRHLSEFLEKEMSSCVLADPAGIERIMEAVYPRLVAGAVPGTDAAAAAAATAKAPPPPPPPAVVAAHMSSSGFAAVSAAEPGPVAGPPVTPFATETAQNGNGAHSLGTRGGRGGSDLDLGDDLSWTAVEAAAAAQGNGDPTSLEDFSGGRVSVDLDELLVYAVENGASDLHLTTQLPPAIRVDGSLRPIEGYPRLDNETIREMIYHVLTQKLRERFEADKELDTSHMIKGVGRFRVNVFQQRGSIGAVLRSIPHEIPSFESLGLPDSVATLAELRRGLVLVTGPTGSGKSTTLASLVNIINRTKPLHIVTIEDPIEFLHSHGRAIVNQREVGEDTESFSEALRHVLRQDPDVILVGEMRDIETIQSALTAAETGHLVFATLHTQDAPQTIDRIIDVFPTGQQDQVRIQLAGSLEAVVTQQLIISATGLGRVVVSEVMMCTPAIRNLIRSAKTHQIYSHMQTGGAVGMQTMDQALARAVKAGLITEAVAYDRSHDPNELRDHLRA